MSEVRSLKVLKSDGTTDGCEVRVTKTAPARLFFSGLGMTGREFEGSDLFEALCALRIHLERSGCKLLCAGARTDVFPSGMSRNMTGGRKAYITELGSPATQTVDILDEASSDVVGTVSQQMEYHKKWMLSLKH